MSAAAGAGSRHVVVCDDEPDLRETVGEYLQKRGYAVSLVENAAALRALVDAGTPIDVILLDINMPGEDGLSLLRWLRGSHGIAVIMVTAAGETVDRVVGLELGADDYLPKPVDLRELEARVKAVLRRTAAPAAEAPPAEAPEAPVEPAERVGFAGFTLDYARAKLFGPEGDEVPLTAMEFRLLKVFVEHRGRVLNRDQLLELAHDRGWDPFDRSIDIRISRLRRKIEPVPEKPELIRTVRGIGYKFDPPGR
ncbi:response regulator [Paralimibaculum aggregatum]|uniref:Response regulator n=1 Tax=Paralimibaculum aggregatum TaxID=3036245 RepID=A0ABQ6LL50_9RHOB|nr:response regulator transcription factor [Limibaculum sp. NKW23]GMG81973.1 response regulator [Limibaculum sp. NKW23]